MQRTKQSVLDAIAALQNPEGTTNIPQGLGWAWRVLMPDPPFTEAVVDPDYDLQKAIVLLTDGENWGGIGDGYKTAFGTGSAAGANGMNARLLDLSTNIKSAGVVLYVIQFANNGTNLQTLLKDVASGPESPFYHYAPDAAALRAVFREIANDLSELRLSK
jgi:Mg-chelatase subunit ChlD